MEEQVKSLQMAANSSSSHGGAPLLHMLLSGKKSGQCALPLPLISFADSQAFFGREASSQNQITSDSHPPFSCLFKIGSSCILIREGDLCFHFTVKSLQQHSAGQRTQL